MKTENAPDTEGILIQTSGVRAVEGKARTLSFVASTEQVARDGDIVRVKGYRTENYEKNPVFLFAHDRHSLPVGKTVAIRKITRGTKRRLEIDVEFAGDEQAHPQAEAVYRLYRDGFLNAVSVGFRRLEREAMTPEKRKDLGLSDWGNVWTQVELLEVSGVPVPSDTDALKREALDDLVAVRGLLEDDLDEETTARWDEAIEHVRGLEDDVTPDEDENSDDEEREDPPSDGYNKDAEVSALRAAIERLTEELAELRGEVIALRDADKVMNDIDEEERAVSDPAPDALENDIDDDPYDLSGEINDRKN